MQLFLGYIFLFVKFGIMLEFFKEISLIIHKNIGLEMKSEVTIVCGIVLKFKLTINVLHKS